MENGFEINLLNKDLINYLTENFNSFFDLKPKEKSKVLVYNKELCLHEEKEIYRSYRSYGNTPKFDPAIKKSYMFSGFDERERMGFEDYPALYKPLVNHVKSLDDKYNQVVINYYNVGDYIEPHRDCDSKMIEDYKILIIDISEPGFFTLFNLYPIDNNEPLGVSLSLGSTLTLNKQGNTVYRHGFNPLSHKRISLTFRQIKN